MQRRESPEERADRNFVELLQEYRVAQQGVQIIFAFLLTLPFTARFEDLDNYHRFLYGISLIAAANSILLFVSPVIQHRLLFHKGFKSQIVKQATRLVRLALGSMLISMLSAIYLVSDVVFNPVMAITFTLAGFVMAGIFWIYVPLKMFKKFSKTG